MAANDLFRGTLVGHSESLAGLGALLALGCSVLGVLRLAGPIPVRTLAVRADSGRVVYVARNPDVLTARALEAL
jgi:hypothetical protein